MGGLENPACALPLGSGAHVEINTVNREFRTEQLPSGPTALGPEQLPSGPSCLRARAAFGPDHERTIVHTHRAIHPQHTRMHMQSKPVMNDDNDYDDDADDDADDDEDDDDADGSLR